jgi:hypothetical protein
MTMNSKLRSPNNLVTLILKNIRLENVSDQNIDAIKGIGAQERKIEGETIWFVPYVDERELAARLEDLNRLGFLFIGADPLGWPPADVFIHLREKRLLKGSFKAITWRGPGDWVVRER